MWLNARDLRGFDIERIEPQGMPSVHSPTVPFGQALISHSQANKPRGAAPPSRRAAWSVRYLSPWYLAYLILGLVNAGLLPFLLPLALEHAGHGLEWVAYVTGAYYAGLLPAPLLGLLAERRRLFRPLFFSGLGLLALDLMVLPAASHLLGWMLLLGAVGFGVGAVSTLAPLFVVDFSPKIEWEPRLGWLQSFNGMGQFVGLLIAGLLVQQPFIYGFWAAAAFSIIAILVGRVGLPSGGRSGEVQPPRIAWAKLLGGIHSGPWLGGLLRHSHHIQGAALRHLPTALGGAFGRLLLAWAAFNFGTAAFFAYYPLLMKESYGVAPAVTAFAYSSAAAIGIVLFLLSGPASKHFGSRSVFQFGLAVRLTGFAVLALLSFVPIPGKTDIAIAGFIVVMLAWPILSVSGTGLAAQLTPVGEGAAMGLLAAGNGAAAMLGTFFGGPLVKSIGYDGAPLIALAGLSCALLLMGGWRREAEALITNDSPSKKPSSNVTPT